MRLLLSRTVTNKLTRFTLVLIAGPCAIGSCGNAGSAMAAARTEVTHSAASFLREGMYTFLDERCPAGNAPLGFFATLRCLEAVPWMRRLESQRPTHHQLREEVWP